MANEYVAPINHGVASTVATTAGGIATGGLKGGIGGWLLGGLIPLVAAGVGIAFIGFATAPAILGSIAVGAIGLVSSYFGSTVGGAIGAGVGSWKGGSRAIDQVKIEKGAATELQAQVDAYKYQALANARASNDNRYNFAAQGTAMNAAAPQIDASSAQTMGTVAAQQLQRA